MYSQAVSWAWGTSREWLQKSREPCCSGIGLCARNKVTHVLLTRVSQLCPRAYTHIHTRTHAHKYTHTQALHTHAFYCTHTHTHTEVHKKIYLAAHALVAPVKLPNATRFFEMVQTGSNDRYGTLRPEVLE
jgi:hypothetical protein